MRRGTMDDFLAEMSQVKGPRFVEVLSHHHHLPAGGTGLNKKSRLGTREVPKFCPYSEVLHVLRTTALVGASYEDMVNSQREREATAAIERLMSELPSFLKLEVDLSKSLQVEPFIAGDLFHGKGEPDPQYPRLAARHKESGQRYLKYWPMTDKDGRLIPNESRYFDQDGNELDFRSQLEEYWKLPSVSKVQETKRQISWRLIKFQNIVQIKANKEVWEIEPSPVAALA